MLCYPHFSCNFIWFSTDHTETLWITRSWFGETPASIFNQTSTFSPFNPQNSPSICASSCAISHLFIAARSLFSVSLVSMVILPTQKGIIDQIISQIMPISYLFSNSFVVNSILFHAPSFLRWQESLTCLHDYFIKYHEHGRQYEDYDYHTDQCSSRHQDTQGTDHIDIGVKSYTDRCCEEA